MRCEATQNYDNYTQNLTQNCNIEESHWLVSGHVWRPNSLMKAVLKCIPKEKNHQAYQNKVEKNLVEIGIQNGLQTVAENRDRWKIEEQKKMETGMCCDDMGLNGI